MENPCLKTGCTVGTDDGKKIHGDLFLMGGELMVRGSRGGISTDIARPAEMVVRVKQHSERDGWQDFVVEAISITPKLARYVSDWTPESLKFIEAQVAQQR